MKLAQFLQPSCLTILMAPPGWGKTSLLFDLMKADQRKLLFLSPLKALSIEFKERSQGLEKQVVFVGTFEALSKNLISEMMKEPSQYYLVMDEFHLILKWGWSFRPFLLERFFELANLGIPILGLSATINDEVKHFCEEGLKFHFQKLYWIDLGNLSLRKYPKKTFLLENKNQAYLLLLQQIKRVHDPILCFVEFRHEVDFYCQSLKERGVRVIGCKGGESHLFYEQMEKCPNPQVIMATSVLGHGVNLPSLKTVFFFYQVCEFDLWLQMVGRGARDGEDYIVYTFDKFCLTRAQIIRSFLRCKLSYYLSFERVAA